MPKNLVLEEKLKKSFLEMKLLDATSSFHVSVLKSGQCIADFSLGKSYQFYDIASLTKIIFTTSVLMEAFEEGLYDPKDSLKKYLPDVKDESIRIEHLLTHSAGHRWWSDFYNQLNPKGTNENMDFRKQWKKLAEILSHEQRENPVSKYVYSDIDFFFLGLLLEELYSKDLLEIFEEYRKSWSLENTFFNVNNHSAFAKNCFAPTEESQYLGYLLQGEVHDENCHALGGVSSHAGLFSDSDSLLHWLIEIRKCLLGRSKMLSAETLALFTQRHTPKELGDWAYGFMKPSEATASCGKYFSDHSFGHTGFTGTSIWFDPDQDLGVILLSNRVHPTRDNKAFVGLRSLIHNEIVEAIQS